MATARSHGVFIYAAGLLYASLGFSLSVLAALFGIFYPFITPPRAQSFHARPHLPRKLSRPRIVRSFSDQTGKVTVPKPLEQLSIEKECTHDVKSLRRRSKTLIPIITIDHFGSTNSPGFLNLLPKPVLPAETLLPTPVNTDGAAKDSSNMSRPRIKRRCSSPLIRPRLASLSVQDSLPVPSTEESKSSANKSPSVAELNQEAFTMKFDSFFLRKAGKKKSHTLQTQPYGPPHFCMPPLPIPNRGLRTSPVHNSQR